MHKMDHNNNKLSLRNMNKILIIEDELTVRNNIVRILKAEKYNPISAENGNIGLKMAQEYLPDVIICDIMMPEMDGYEVLTKLQENHQTKLIPFIFLTALAERTDYRKGVELGADDYLVKPFDADELLKAVRIKLKKKDLLQENLKELYHKLENFKNFMETKDGMIDNFNQEMRRPLGNIKLALEMLEKESNPELKQRYVGILRHEFEREINLLNQISELKQLLTPDNIHLLSQFNMLKF